VSVKKVLHAGYLHRGYFSAGVVIPDSVVWVYFFTILHLAIPFHYDRHLREFLGIILYLSKPKLLVGLTLCDRRGVLDILPDPLTTRRR
jgi:hypothetical protein